MAPPDPYITPHLPYRSSHEKQSPTDSGNETPADHYPANVSDSHLIARRLQTFGGTSGPNAQAAPQKRSRKQEIHNDFRHLATVGFTSLVMGTWEHLLTANLPALINGGIPTLFWSMVWCYIGQLFLVLSLAELSSMVPMTGGQFQWISVSAPRRYQQAWAYYSGWLCSIGWQARFTADCCMIAETIHALIKINHRSTYNHKDWHQGSLTILTSFVISAFNALAAGHLSIAEGFFAICHIFAFVPIAVSFWVLGPMYKAQNVLFDLTDYGGGWPNKSMMPHRLTPHCMLWAFLLNIPMTLAMLITFCFNLDSVEEAVKDTLPPFVSAFRQIFQSKQATTGFTIVVLSLLVMIAISMMVATSRHLFAFGRREIALLFPGWFSRVNIRLKVPLNAILSTTLFTTIVALATIDCSSALNTMMALSICCLMSTYIACICSLVWKRLQHKVLPRARWSLGRAGLLINVIALVYSSWCFFWSFWPVFYKVTGDNFQWTVVIFVVVVLIMVLCYKGGKERKCQTKGDDTAYTLQPVPLWNDED